MTTPTPSKEQTTMAAMAPPFGLPDETAPSVDPGPFVEVALEVVLARLELVGGLAVLELSCGLS